MQVLYNQHCIIHKRVERTNEEAKRNYAGNIITHNKQCKIAIKKKPKCERKHNSEAKPK